MSTNPNPNSTTPNPTPQPTKKKTRPNAFADTLRDWESLISAVADQAAVLAPIDSHRAALADSLEKARQAKTLQESRVASKQGTTQSLKAIVTEGKDRARRLRGAILAELGTTTEQLKQFGIPPLRRRPPRHNPDGVSTPPPAPQPEVQATKAVRGTE
ncbi:MAG TPA: hypothetical protein VFE33_29720 [Thermoanaerobaculia bacterium]|nr:hypothetical protein [Thermoanaerobaculia bacterium]